MKLLFNTLSALNTLTITVGLASSAFALDPAMLYQRSSPAIAEIIVPMGKSVGYGTGFITNPKGLILTNCHVVGNNLQVGVRLANGSVYRGVITSRNPQVDLAVIQIQPKQQLPFLRILAVPPKIGQKVYVIGNPRGLARSLSDGTVSRIDQSGLIQFTAPVTFGNSGGPLLDEDGRVLGVVEGGVVGTALGFAEPIAAIYHLPGQTATADQRLLYDYITAALLQERQGNYRTALAISNAGIQRFPNSAVLYSNRGQIKLSLRDTQGAMEDFTRSIQIHPTSLAYFNRGLLYQETLKQPRQALEDFTEAIRVNRNWGSITLGNGFYRRGLVEAQLGNKPAAISAFKQSARFFSQIGNAEGYQRALDQITLISAQ